MAIQNLVSAELPPAVKTEVTRKLSEVKKALAFLTTLRSEEIQGLVKAGNGFAPFLEKAYGAAEAHPEILPSVFDTAEFRKDYRLSKDLSVIAAQVNELADTLKDTLVAVNSDAMNAALDVYAAVKQNRDRVPGLKTVADDMSEFFKRNRKNTEKETPSN